MYLVLLQSVTVSSAPSPFLVAFVGALIGSILSGGGIILLARLALTEKLRSTFADREQSVSKTDLANLRAEFAVLVRTEVTSVIGTAENRVMREYARLQKDLDRAIGAMEATAEQARADGRLAEQAMSEARLARQQAEALERLVSEFIKRFTHIEQSLDRIERSELARASGAS